LASANVAGERRRRDGALGARGDPSDVGAARRDPCLSQSREKVLGPAEIDDALVRVRAADVGLSATDEFVAYSVGRPFERAFDEG
jgi:hypothetical protein